MSTKKIIGTGKNPDIPKGKEYIESEDVANILVNGGYATYANEQPAVKEPNKSTGEKWETGSTAKNKEAKPAAKAKK